jgi:hypothetical protein
MRATQASILGQLVSVKSTAPRSLGARSCRAALGR